MQWRLSEDYKREVFRSGFLGEHYAACYRVSYSLTIHRYESTSSKKERHQQLDSVQAPCTIWNAFRHPTWPPASTPEWQRSYAGRCSAVFVSPVGTYQTPHQGTWNDRRRLNRPPELAVPCATQFPCLREQIVSLIRQWKYFKISCVPLFALILVSLLKILLSITSRINNVIGATNNQYLNNCTILWCLICFKVILAIFLSLV